MSELDDQLNRDGARWRGQVDARHGSDAELMLDQVTARPILRSMPTVATLRRRFPARASLLVSMAALIAAVLTISGAVLGSGSHHAHPTGALPLGLASNSAVASVPPLHLPWPSPAPHPARTTSAPPVGVRTSSPNPTEGHRHTTVPPAPSDNPSQNLTMPPACDSAALAVWVSDPTISDPTTSTADASGTMTVFVANQGTSSCTITGVPTVQLSGDTTLTAIPAADVDSQVTLAAGQTASAQLTWNTTTTPGECSSYGTTVVSLPDGATTQLSLDAPVQVCDPSTLDVQPLVAS